MRNQGEEDRSDHQLYRTEGPAEESSAAKPAGKSGVRQCQYLPGTGDGLHCVVVRAIQSYADNRVLEGSQAIERRTNAS